MQYIKIKNKGAIQPEALHLVGASTKHNDSSKIGQFGSGNKYALAYLLRNGYDVKIFSGLNEIKIGRRKKTFRKNTFNIITIAGKQTSITDEMGKDWKFWQAMRELFSNALDEGEATIEHVEEIKPKGKETHFYIENKKDAADFLLNFDNYFATNKKVLFECSTGRILEKSGNKANLYRKGICCLDGNKSSLYDYDFNEINIDENRLIKYFWTIEEKIWSLIYQCDNEEVISNILNNCTNPEYIEGCLSDISSIDNSLLSETFKQFIQKVKLAPQSMGKMLTNNQEKTHIVIPTKIFSSINEVINAGQEDEFKASDKGILFREVEITHDQDLAIKRAFEFFKIAQFEITAPIAIGIFEDKNQLGLTHEGKIVLSDTLLENSDEVIVNCIFEQYFHLKYYSGTERKPLESIILSEFMSFIKFTLIPADAQHENDHQA